MSDEQSKLKKTLYPYLQNALASYETFLAKESWSDAKEFSAYHGACKAVLQHIALLLKLIGVQDTVSTDTDDFTKWIERAKSAVIQEEENDVDID